MPIISVLVMLNAPENLDSDLVARDVKSTLAGFLSDSVSGNGYADVTVGNVIPYYQSEPPLLQCIDCKNTESPAGAMARHFNHGRCLHCGGFFKVIRA
jgi:hypothetical protein